MLKHDPNEILYAVSNLTRAALLSGVVIGGLGPSASAADRKTLISRFGPQTRKPTTTIWTRIF